MCSKFLDVPGRFGSMVNGSMGIFHLTHALRIQVCPRKGISPTILLWGWDWDHQNYSREGYGSLGMRYIGVHNWRTENQIFDPNLTQTGPTQRTTWHLPRLKIVRPLFFVGLMNEHPLVSLKKALGCKLRLVKPACQTNRKLKATKGQEPSPARTSQLEKWDDSTMIFFGGMQSLYMQMYPRWWQLKYFLYFHPEPWGRFAICPVIPPEVWCFYVCKFGVQVPSNFVVFGCHMSHNYGHFKGFCRR